MAYTNQAASKCPKGHVDFGSKESMSSPPFEPEVEAKVEMMIIEDDPNDVEFKDWFSDLEYEDVSMEGSMQDDPVQFEELEHQDEVDY